jgi:hypothetical protein
LRKKHVLTLVASVTALLVLAAVALAQQNVYTVSGTVPSGGTKAKPKPIGLKFGYTVGEATGNLASPVTTYKITFQGLKADTSAVKGKCTAASINAAQSNSGCAANAKVGSGTVKALVGTAGQPTDPNAKCDLDLTIYSGGGKHLTLYLAGDTPNCIAHIAQAIDAPLTASSTGSSLSFTVPPTLLHPVTGLDVAVTSVQSTIKKITKGKKGFFASVGCSGQRKVSVQFTAENGQTESAENTAGKC